VANICKICRLPNQELVRAAFTSGATDRQLAQQFNVSHSAVGRHRRAHLLAPVRAAVAVLDKGQTALRQREQQLAAIEQGDPVAIALAAFGMPRQLDKVAQVEQRLERMAAAAETASSSAGVAQLSAQQLRSVEVGSRLAGTGGYKPPSVGSPMAEKATVSIEFVFQNAPKETIALTSSPVIDGDLSDPNSETPFPSPPPKQKFQGSIRDYWNFSEQHHSAQGQDDPKED
jgi:hypothetical protein